MFWQMNELVILVGLIALFLAVNEVGFRLGMKSSSDGDVEGHRHIGTLQGGLLGLLGLLLGFTFAMAVSHYDARKALVLEESNAISSAHLQTQLLPQPHRDNASRLFKEYVEARLAFYDAGTDSDRLKSSIDVATRIQKKLWEVAVATVTNAPDAQGPAMFAQTVNGLIDDTEKRQAALTDHVPEPVLLLLLSVACVAMGFVTFGCGLDHRRRFGLNTILALIIAVVMTLILDIDQPRRGVIHVSQDSMLRLKAELENTSP